MPEADKVYDPLSYARNGVKPEEKDGGIGLDEAKNPTPTLRIFGSNLGNQWLHYGTIAGGTQDWQPPPDGTNGPGACTWFRFYYSGLMEIDGDAVFGNWKVTVEGKGLEPVAQKIGKHTKTSLKVGEKATNSSHPITVGRITIEPFKPKKMKIVAGQMKAVDPGDDEEDEGFEPED